jgi:prepilin-type N-terminal cleavage/methylation domain-containing protein
MKKRGFTLIEMMVATTLFATVMLIALGALLLLIDANRKAQALQSVMNNLNVALDGLVRNVRMGSQYHCTAAGNVSVPLDCAGGLDYFSFEPFGGNPTDASDQWVIRVVTDAGGLKRIQKSVTGEGGPYFDMIAPEVQIEEFKVYVTGSVQSDGVQPRTVFVLKGTAGAEKARTRTTFNIQASATQRILDL